MRAAPALVVFLSLAAACDSQLGVPVADFVMTDAIDIRVEVPSDVDATRVRAGLFPIAGLAQLESGPAGGTPLALTLVVTEDGFIEVDPDTQQDPLPEPPTARLSPKWMFTERDGHVVVEWPVTGDSEELYTLIVWEDTDDDGSLTIDLAAGPQEVARTPSRIFENYDAGQDVSLHLSTLSAVHDEGSDSDPDGLAGWFLRVHGKFSEASVNRDETDGWSAELVAP